MRAFRLVAVAEALIVAVPLVEFGFTLEALQSMTRFSGRLSLVLFSLMFLLLPGNEDIFKRNITSKPFHLFAFAHGIHLAELLCFVYLAQVQLIPYRLAGGMLAYAFIFAMPVLHQRNAAGLMEEKRFKTATTLYLFYLWLIFFMTYLPRVQGRLQDVGGTYIEFVVLLAWVSLLMGLRIARVFFGRLKTASRP